jgi:hypothetical protein
MVLNYHHVIPDNLFEENLLYGYAHKRSSFETQVEILSKKYGFSDQFGVKNCVITFDDGIINNLTEAVPALAKYKVKAYFFCVEENIGSQESLWIDQFYLWFSYIPKGTYVFEGTEMAIGDHPSRLAASLMVWQWFCQIKPSSADLLSKLDDIYPFQALESVSKKNALRLKPMNQKELNDLVNSGHYVGFHSRTHQVLAHLDIEALQKEVTPTTGIFNTSAMAIPFGTENEINQTVMEVLKSIGHSPILLNEMKSAFTGIPRLNLPDTSNKYEIHSHLCGLHGFIQRFL